MPADFTSVQYPLPLLCESLFQVGNMGATRLCIHLHGITSVVVLATFLELLVGIEFAAGVVLKQQSEDAQTLLQFRNSVVDVPSGSFFSTWNSSDPTACNWFGVTCDLPTSAVISLSLPGQGLRGTPVDLSRLSSLRFLNLSGNNLSGFVPSNLSTTLTVIDLSRNQFSGPIPDDLLGAGAIDLQILDLSNNGLTGSIPATLGQLRNLVMLNLNGNRLEGVVPETLENLVNLTHLLLQGNSLNGSLPASLSNCFNLRVLDVQFNNLTGGIPLQLQKLKNLAKLDLHSNDLSGSIPPQLGVMSSLTRINLAANGFSGNIPQEIGQLQNLRRLILRSNALTGAIPAAISTLSKLEVLDLSNNQLTGSIPSDLARMPSLTFIDISNNQLTGPVPESPAFTASPPGSFSGNRGLRGSPLRECKLSANVAKFPAAAPSPVGATLKKKGTCGFAGFVVLGILMLLTLLFFLLRFCRSKFPAPVTGQETPGPAQRSNQSFPQKGDAKTPRDFPSHHSEDFNFSRSVDDSEHVSIAQDELNKIFKQEDIVSANKYSTLYRVGALESDHQYLIKRVNVDKNILEAHAEHITGELESLRGLAHKHIMRPVHFFIFNQKLLLMYKDTLAHGTLRQCLDSDAWALDWERRYQIALGIAQGLAFFHQAYQPPTVHLDISSSNILLDEEFAPLVGDVELSKILDPAKVHRESVATFPSSSGYIAPEYAYTSRVTPSSNVFSYGVVLLELLSGRRCDEDRDLVKWLKESVHLKVDLIEEVIDPELRSGVCLKKAIRQEILFVLSIALRCTEVLPSQRPEMITVVQMMQDMRTR